MSRNEPSLPESSTEDRPDIITIACILGWAILLGDLLLLLLPTIRQDFFKIHPAYIFYLIVALDFLFACAFWLIWQMKTIGIWLYSLALILMLCGEYVYSIKQFTSITLGVTFLIIFIYYYRDMK